MCWSWWFRRVLQCLEKGSPKAGCSLTTLLHPFFPDLVLLFLKDCIPRFVAHSWLRFSSFCQAAAPHLGSFSIGRLHRNHGGFPKPCFCLYTDIWVRWTCAVLLVAAGKQELVGVVQGLPSEHPSFSKWSYLTARKQREISVQLFSHPFCAFSCLKVLDCTLQVIL